MSPLADPDGHNEPASFDELAPIEADMIGDVVAAFEDPFREPIVGRIPIFQGIAGVASFVMRVAAATITSVIGLIMMALAGVSTANATKLASERRDQSF